MAKRYVDTNLPNKRWFRKLEPEFKVLWFYVTLLCDHAGILDLDLDIVKIKIGCKTKFTDENIQEAFGNRIIKIGDDKWYLTGFIDFQQGERKVREGTNSNIYNSIINRLKHEGLWQGFMDGLAQPLTKGYSNSNSNSKELYSEDKGSKKKKQERKLALKRNREQFELLWSEYPKKRGKKPSSWRYKTMIPDDELFNLIYSDITERSKSYDWRKEDGKYVPLMTTYLNQEGWNDDMFPVDPPASEHGDAGRGPYIEPEEDS